MADRRSYLGKRIYRQVVHGAAPAARCPLPAPPGFIPRSRLARKGPTRATAMRVTPTGLGGLVGHRQGEAGSGKMC